MWSSMTRDLGDAGVLATMGTCEAFSGTAGVLALDGGLGLLGSEEGLSPVLGEVGSVVRLRLKDP